jgi:hypothetical protein
VPHVCVCDLIELLFEIDNIKKREENAKHSCYISFNHTVLERNQKVIL